MHKANTNTLCTVNNLPCACDDEKLILLVLFSKDFFTPGWRTKELRRQQQCVGVCVYVCGCEGEMQEIVAGEIKKSGKE